MRSRRASARAAQVRERSGGTADDFFLRRSTTCSPPLLDTRHSHHSAATCRCLEVVWLWWVSEDQSPARRAAISSGAAAQDGHARCTMSLPSLPMGRGGSQPDPVRAAPAAGDQHGVVVANGGPAPDFRARGGLPPQRARASVQRVHCAVPRADVNGARRQRGLALDAAARLVAPQQAAASETTVLELGRLCSASLYGADHTGGRVPDRDLRWRKIPAGEQARARAGLQLLPDNAVVCTQ